MKIDWIEDGVLAASSTPVGLTDLRWLREQGISAILSLTENPLTIQQNVDDAAFDALDIVYYHAPVQDGEAPDRETAQYALDFIRQMHAGGRATLAHCQAGGGRTGTLLHLYYLAQGHDLETVKGHIKAQRAASAWDMLSDAQRAFLEDAAANGLG
jgi:atypical dual specificity phosphatase